MPKLEKNVLALTFKYDCDRFLRFELTARDDRKQLGIDSFDKHRPGVELMAAAGRRWEADKYQDLINVAGNDRIEYKLSNEIDPLIGRQRFDKVENIFEILRGNKLPVAIIEGEFLVPDDITPKLQEAYKQYKLDPVKARPDIIWIRRYRTGSPLIGNVSDRIEFELHIIDVKMAAEPSLRHFAEVTFYAISLARALEREGLSDRFAVSAEGFIWPGSHDANAFRNLYQEYQSKGDVDALTSALLKTLLPVPYEVYQIHVKQFFDERLLKVLAQAPLDTAWHVSPRCQLCNYQDYCLTRAKNEDHLSQISRLNRGQAELLNSRGINSTEQLITAADSNSEAWRSTLAVSHQLKAESKAITARARALKQNRLEIINGRKCSMMPAWSDLSIFITAHFDPGSGIAFALGASKIYFPPGRKTGEPPIKEEQAFIIDRVYRMNTDTERARLVEFVQLITRWLQEVDQINRKISAERSENGERDKDYGKLSAHIFFWDGLEVKQLRRMFERHMDNEQVVDMIELLIRLFPPDNILPEPELFRSQPGTVVKDVINLLFGLPIAHNYTLLDVANNFYPNINKNGKPFIYQLPFGFDTNMADQIPYERAYELWEDRIFLRKFDENYPEQPQYWSKYTRDQIYDGIKKTVITRLHALQHIVEKLRRNHKELLTLRKSSFKAAPSVKARVPEAARKLIAFEKLNSACQEIENRHFRFLPIEEREARFISVRGLTFNSGNDYKEIIEEIRTNQSRYKNALLLPFSFADTSRDARIKEGEFLWSISNEDSDWDLDVPWYLNLDISFSDAKQLLNANDIGWESVIRQSLSKLLQVEIVYLDTTSQIPFVIITPNQTRLFQFAQNQRLIDLSRDLILDPIYQDFDTKRIEQALRIIGGSANKTRR